MDLLSTKMARFVYRFVLLCAVVEFDCYRYFQIIIIIFYILSIFIQCKGAPRNQECYRILQGMSSFSVVFIISCCGNK